jgi:hypothetical protein
MNPPPVPLPAPAPCGARPDAESADCIYLIKIVPLLRATRQVRLLALRAALTHRSLVLCVPRDCRWDQDLAGLAVRLPGIVRRQDLP